MEKSKYLLILLCILLFALFSAGLKSNEPVEDVEIITGVGNDMERNNSGVIKYSIPMSVYLFKNDNTIESDTRMGEAYTVPETRENRQLIEDKQNILGLEKLYIFSEEQSRNGLLPCMEILLRNPNINDKGYVVVCKGKAYDILNLRVKGYPSSADYLEGLLKNSIFQNFYSEKNKLSDTYLNILSEGENTAMPYIEIKNGKIAMSGMALFNKDKMTAMLDIKDAKLLNILREDAGQGILTIAKNSEGNFSLYSKVKRKVIASKQDGKYKYIINLKFTGDVIYNQQYKNFLKDANEIKIIESDMEKSIQKSCMQFIKKAQQDYKIDCLSLGKYAAAKYGRHKGINWDEVFSNADIEVKVKVKIERTGRGQF